jgi:hypothetical protein
MATGKAFVVVGHSNWGKSKTLSALTDNKHQVRKIVLKGKKFLIRRMSNDDVPDDLIAFLCKLDPLQWPYLIITLCPNFEDPAKRTVEILKRLTQKYEASFWVMLHKFRGKATILPGEVDRLAAYGRTEIFDSRESDASERAAAFRSFVEALA